LRRLRLRSEGLAVEGWCVVRLGDVRGVLLLDGEVRRVNELRFWLTKVLKDFNKRNSKYVALLKVNVCSPRICGDRTVFFQVDVRRRDKSKVVMVNILFSYNLDKDQRAFLGIDGHWQSLDFDGVCEFALDLARDISVLAMRLYEVFGVA
jgi:hypothetical protein